VSEGHPIEPSAERRPWGITGWVIVVGAFLIGFVVFPIRTLGSDLSYLPGDALDNRLNNYILEHGYRYLTGRADSFWNAPFFYPLSRVTTWSDGRPGRIHSRSRSRWPHNFSMLNCSRGFWCRWLRCLAGNSSKNPGLLG
jgi:hypothetical protein